nr:GAF domain-containing protein [Pseudonocardia acidicola]
MSLDELLMQLIDRAGEMQRTHRRLRGLLQATQAIARTEDLDHLLADVVKAARTLVGAEYGALGVIEQGQLARFIHAGMDRDTVDLIGHLPEGKGLLGLLASAPEPIRLTDLAEHPAAVGFPQHHPLMRSFLGVPIHVRGEVFGALYLAGKTGEGANGFSDDDEELMLALAGSAGAAVEYGTLLEQAQRRASAQEAISRLATHLLAGYDVDDGLADLLQAAQELTRSYGAILMVAPVGADRVRVTHAVGGLAAWRGQEQARAGSLFDAVMRHDAPTAVIDDVRAAPHVGLAAQEAPEIGPVLAARFAYVEDTAGLLVVTRTGQSSRYLHSEVAIVGALAEQAGLALQIAQDRNHRAVLEQVRQREALAFDLNDTLMTRLSALGMRLSGLASEQPTPQARDRLLAEIGRLDEVVRAMRGMIFDIGTG